MPPPHPGGSGRDDVTAGVPCDAGEEGRGGKVGWGEEDTAQLRKQYGKENSTEKRNVQNDFYLGCVDLVQNILLACCHYPALCFFRIFPLLRRMGGDFWHLTSPQSSSRLLSKQADGIDSTTSQ